MKTGIRRRSFLRHTGLGGAGVLLLSNARLAFAAEANSRLHVAGVGVAGQGRGNLDNIAGAGAAIVALCDVDQRYAADTFKKYPEARAFTDFRRLLDDLGASVDAVVVSTPDHTHAVAAVAAMQRGKHVFCEKPLTRTVREARAMREAARKHRVVTQMGNQGSASDGLRRGTELVLDGVIGEVREAHVWFDGGNSPLERPKDTPPVPATLDWDLWLGPAEFRPYHPSYLPGSWRGWRAFGSGIVGDFGCHTGNLMFRALNLAALWEAPTNPLADRRVIRVQAWPSEVDAEGYPRALKAVVELPARGSLPPVKLTVWAKDKPPADLLLGYPQQGWGDLLIGSKGSIYSECPWNTRYTLLPEERFDGTPAGAPQRLPRSIGHHREWVEACKGNGRTFSSFDIGGPLTELMQLVNAATLEEGPLDYDPLAGRILNHDRANARLHREYRPGWSLGDV
ncbi:MAG: Gfo/Idh/MocA family oxidoreductase [Verrucomicrobiales bacterium]|nr:Gfo/Idh/MocA family oxidoreductase [Verrucomicrobiales bacterium]